MAMRWDPLLRLLGETDQGKATARLRRGCKLVIERSTWGQFAKAGADFNRNDIAAMADAMTRFILSPLNCSIQPVSLLRDYDTIGREFDVYVFAEIFSADNLSESTHLSADRIAASEASDIEDQATAALLFRYKHCFLAGEFFDTRYVIDWAVLIATKPATTVNCDKVFQLLEVLNAVIEVPYEEKAK